MKGILLLSIIFIITIAIAVIFKINYIGISIITLILLFSFDNIFYK